MNFRKISGFVSLVLACGCGPGPDRQAVLHTSMGDMRVRLFGAEQQPVQSFLEMAGDSLVVAFVERDGIIEAARPGDTVDPGDLPAKNPVRPETEGGRRARRGSLVMPVPAGNESAGRPDPIRFFILLGAPSVLPGPCVVFGEVTGGMEVGDRIGAVPRRADGRPLKEIYLEVVPSR
jgi:cyclophilin family peptidyl-prolyl cis-trans isomerase